MRIKTTSRCHPPGFRAREPGGFCSIPAILGPDNAAYIRAGIKRLHHQIAPPSRASIRYTTLSLSLSLSLEHPLSSSTPRIVFPPFASCLLAELSSFASPPRSSPRTPGPPLLMSLFTPRIHLARAEYYSSLRG